MNDAIDDRPDWPLRPWLLAAIGASVGLAIHLVLGDLDYPNQPSVLQVTIAAFLGSAALLIGFTIERVRVVWSLIFSGVCALTIALVFYWNGAPQDWGSAENWRTVCGLLAVAIAAPLFQAARDAGAARFAYVEVHGHAWTNVVMWAAACGFTAITFLLGWLLAELFTLIKITLLKDALETQWFAMMLIGTAFGAAIGVFRERDRIVRLLLNVVVAVLGVLAPVLGAGLILFLASLPFTGLDALWDATKATTPILLTCTVGALILANAVIGRNAEEESRFPPLRWGALALAVAMLPLAVIAAVSTGSRIQQYGFTPDRLWALVFVIVACGYGAAYLYAVVRGRTEWAQKVRPLNLKLGFALCALALFLALPILSFNAISTRDQVARLESGRVSADKFDWAALRFDFGEPGKAAVARLVKSGNAAIRAAAISTAPSEDRALLDEQLRRKQAVERLRRHVRILPRPTPLPPGLLEAFAEHGMNDQNNGKAYVLFYESGAREAILATGCATCFSEVTVRYPDNQGGWQRRDSPRDRGSNRNPEIATGLARGRVEIRTVERRQVFVDGEPINADFE